MLQLKPEQEKAAFFFSNDVIANIKSNPQKYRDSAVSIKQKAFIDFLKSEKYDPKVSETGFNLMNVDYPVDNEELAWEIGTFPHIVDIYTAYQNLVYYVLASTGMIDPNATTPAEISSIRNEIVKNMEKYFKAFINVYSIYGKRDANGDVDGNAPFEIVASEKSYSLKAICETFGHISESDMMTVNAAIQAGALTPDKKIERMKKNTSIYEHIIGIKVKNPDGSETIREDLSFAICGLTITGLGQLANMSGSMYMYIGVEPDIESQTILALDKVFRS